MKLSVLGIGSVSALGDGVESLRGGLDGSIQPRVERETIATPSGSVELPVFRADAKGLEQFVERRAMRRLDRFTRMTLVASFQALEDAGVNIEDRTRVGVVFGTGFGPSTTTFDYQDTIINDGDASASPTLFANSVHNAVASAVSIFTKFQGPCLTLTNLDLVFAEVLATASDWLERGTVDYVLAGVGDEYCPVLGYAVSQLGSESPDKIDPLQFSSCSYVPADGSIAFLLGGETGSGSDSCSQRYGSVLEVVSSPASAPLDPALLDRHRAILLSANGNRRTGPSYAKLELGNTKVAAYAPLYGSLPVGLGFDVALAAVSFGMGQLNPSPSKTNPSSLNLLTEPIPLGRGDRIGCIECTKNRKALVCVGQG